MPTKTPEALPEVARTAPERIYLLVSDDREYSSQPFPRNPDGDEVTWCEDQALDCNVEYARADLLAAKDQQIEALREDLQQLHDAMIGTSIEAQADALRAARARLFPTQPTFYGKGEVQAAIAAIRSSTQPEDTQT